ncbi:MAG: ATP--guanido phosphotransferase [candidate division KSB1 bacterium]|nr:ATP--guanido phosphotransferase [candidate division KSB1 bacterium]MDZ7272611.1 ATP--guanido phosphotransferase [candidate division KSB1 bacterium]MDZ7284366.1 ATP--guanido phosphotransferase [candidate division KSB1 bacterium]MDZ7297238.1 ATP--guanido phosphotransferase [candidate division KSB1 bacterium]MDZ7308305.1 ATP--guanido phosphotransferase [candidate division KSB1 bacterium]
MKHESNKPQETWETAAASSRRYCNELAKTIPSWLQRSGPYGNIVLATRIRLARNLAAHPFPNKADRNSQAQVIAKVWEALASLPLVTPIRCLELSRLSRLDREMLVERRLASPAFIMRTGPRLLALTADESLSLMINEEDHLRLQTLQPGLAIVDAWQAISAFDDLLSERLDYAFSERFGYLTACPTNTGTGIRVSVLMHLPALALVGGIESAKRRLAQHGMTMRGFYGEGTAASGNMFQISNQLTLGKSEMEVMTEVTEMVQDLYQLEEYTRGELMMPPNDFLFDRIGRAYGTLRYARMLNSQECLDLLSMLRLGHDCGQPEMKNWPLALLNELTLMLQPGHLRKTHSGTARAFARDVLRATLLRVKLGLHS